jgi:hypothetical protein
MAAVATVVGGGGKNHGNYMLFKMSMQLSYMYNRSTIDFSYQNKDIMLRIIIEYNNSKGFWPLKIKLS